MRLGILIVEDNRKQRERIRKNLADEHSDVIIDRAETVREAVDLIRSAAARGVHYLVVILDIKLPGEKGENHTFHFELRDQVLTWVGSDTYIFFHSTTWMIRPSDSTSAGSRRDQEQRPGTPNLLLFEDGIRGRGAILRKD